MSNHRPSDDMVKVFQNQNGYEGDASKYGQMNLIMLHQYI